MSNVDSFLIPEAINSFEEIPRPQHKSLYVKASLQPYVSREDEAELKASPFWVYTSLTALLIGLAITPIDLATGAVIGIPGLLYLVSARK